jgi:predicted MPP superfamily phosphohydrolase
LWLSHLQQHPLTENVREKLIWTMLQEPSNHPHWLSYHVLSDLVPNLDSSLMTMIHHHLPEIVTDGENRAMLHCVAHSHSFSRIYLVYLVVLMTPHYGDVSLHQQCQYHQSFDPEGCSGSVLQWLH